MWRRNNEHTTVTNDDDHDDCATNGDSECDKNVEIILILWLSSPPPLIIHLLSFSEIPRFVRIYLSIFFRTFDSNKWSFVSSVMNRGNCQWNSLYRQDLSLYANYIILFNFKKFRRNVFLHTNLINQYLLFWLLCELLIRWRAKQKAVLDNIIDAFYWMDRLSGYDYQISYYWISIESSNRGQCKRYLFITLCRSFLVWLFLSFRLLFCPKRNTKQIRNDWSKTKVRRTTKKKERRKLNQKQKYNCKTRRFFCLSSSCRFDILHERHLSDDMQLVIMTWMQLWKKHHNDKNIQFGNLTFFYRARARLM